MRVAVCYSGQLRTGFKTVENHLAFFGDLKVDVFVHTWDHQLNKRPGSIAEPVSFAEIDKFVKAHHAKMLIVENFYSERIANQFHSPLYYSWKKSVELSQIYQKQHNIQYDAVIKLRPDVIFGPNKKLIDDVMLVKDNPTAFFLDNFPPNWEEIGFADDVYWISSPSAMNIAIGFYDNTQHKLLPAYLKSQQVSFDTTTLKYPNYTIYREECLQFSPIDEFEACRACDIMYFHYKSPWYSKLTAPSI